MQSLEAAAHNYGMNIFILTGDSSTQIKKAGADLLLPGLQLAY
jgi:hypothetical protein